MPINKDSRRDVYVYASQVIDIPATESRDDSINIQADADFIIHKLTMFAVQRGLATPLQGSDSTRIIPNVTVQITDQGSGRQLFNEAVHIGSIFGTGSLPFILPAPRRIASNSVLALNYTNLSSVDYDLFLSFIGLKYYVGR